jgi:hypothetical protein
LTESSVIVEQVIILNPSIGLEILTLEIQSAVVCLQTCQKIATMGSYNVTLKREQLKITKGELAVSLRLHVEFDFSD